MDLAVTTNPADLLMGALPRSEWENVKRVNASWARERRKSAQMTERHAPQTKRNAKVVVKWIAEAEQAEHIVTLCDRALTAPASPNGSAPQATDGLGNRVNIGKVTYGPGVGVFNTERPNVSTITSSPQDADEFSLRAFPASFARTVADDAPHSQDETTEEAK